MGNKSLFGFSLTYSVNSSRLNSRYGIIGTPTILLWVDGNVVSRMDEAPFSLKAFRNYIEKWTDLELEYVSGLESEESLIENIGKFFRCLQLHILIALI